MPLRDYLTALCADRLALVLCVLAGNKDVPPLYADKFLTPQEIPETGRFASGEEFEAWWRGEAAQ